VSYTDWTFVEEYVDPGLGRGIRATRGIPAGTVVGIYDGRLTAFELANGKLIDPAMHKRIVQVAVVGDVLFGLLNEKVSGIDYINHSCKANIVAKDRIVLVAASDVAVGEALTLDYRVWDLIPEGIACWCEPSLCRL
jgi:SET domain